MKTIIFLIAFLFTSANLVQAQNKRITVYYNGDSTEVVNLANTDSIIVFICGASRVKYDDKFYNTVPIGEQCWLKENLNVGTRKDGNILQSNNGEIEKYCYNDDPANCITYGGLYLWEEMMQYYWSEGTQGICPDGWHLPSSSEFATLINNVDDDGNSLKAIGEGYDDGAGTNASGFSALLVGRSYFGVFAYLTNRAYFWTSSHLMVNDAWYINLFDNNSTIVDYNTSNWQHAYSVRCIMD